MGDEPFSGTLLTDKLSKLNSSQQSIESVSHWCISHRKRAKLVVETWNKLFKSAQPQQQVSFLYLSNDILQNSRRKGSEFVNEFWKVLPDALKGVHDGGNEDCRKVTSRLRYKVLLNSLDDLASIVTHNFPFWPNKIEGQMKVDIWEQRKVFGSRGQIFKIDVLEKNPLPANIVNNVNPIKVVKRDAISLRVKLAVGGLPEKILTAMQLVQDEVGGEEEALNKCRDAVSCVRDLEKDAVNASAQGNLQGSDLVVNIQKQEDTIQQCISELEKSENIRDSLVSQLREALLDQESKLEQIRSELLVARAQIQQAANTRLQLMSSSAPSPSLALKQPPPIEPNAFPPPQPTTTTAPPSFMNPTKEESKKSAAAVVAAKLAASTSSAQMLTSILSSLVAEEAASMSTGLKRPKLDPTEGGPPLNPAYFSNANQVFTNMPSQSISQVSQLQTTFPPVLVNSNQLVPQPNSNMTGLSYGYGGAMAFAMPAGPPPQQAQPPGSGGYYRPVGAGFYGQSHQAPTTPPIHRP